MPDFVGSTTPLSATGVADFGTTTATGEPEMWSVLTVETSGSGFLPDRRPKILFERHWFHAFTRGAFVASHPDISQPTPGGYEGGAAEYSRLADAIALDRTSALKSASWGIGQVMGFNFGAAGFADVESMCDAMADGEDQQLGAMANFLVANHLAAPLAGHDWAGFARGYNGSGYAQRNYDGRLKDAYAKFAIGPLPDIGVREVQLLLTLHGADLVIDGVAGTNTNAAIRAFRATNGLPPGDGIDSDLLKKLRF